ncbi:MAG: hypothetical protein JWN67_2109, partial [Actinomycetia bacterium]|nr:hypothetical protein [Actinomycetes bacterium]
PGDDVALSDEARRNLLAWYARDVELLARCRELRPDPIG